MSGDVPIREAATLLPLRDAGSHLEVCLLRRNPSSTWVAGLALFPGGAVDETDSDPALAGLITLRPGDTASTLAGGLAPWVAALRETYEEIGLVLATTAATNTWTWADPSARTRVDAARTAVAGAAAQFAAVVADAALTLRIDRMRFIAHWVTPPGQARRYDTRFYIAAVPPSAPAHPDGTEIVRADWVRPSAAITAHAAGELPMLPPTLAALHWLAQFGSTDDALAGADALGEIPRLAPGDLSDAARATLTGPPAAAPAAAPAERP